MNDYERAAERFEKISRTRAGIIAEAEQMIRDAEDEYEAAELDLRRHESFPGVPRPGYRKAG